MPISVSQRIQKRRDAMRAGGLCPVQIWVPDTRRAGFAAKCARQATLVAASDRSDAGLVSYLEDAAGGIDGWE